MCVRRTKVLTSMTDGIFGLGAMQGENQNKGVSRYCRGRVQFKVRLVFVLAHVIVSPTRFDSSSEFGPSQVNRCYLDASSLDWDKDICTPCPLHKAVTSLQRRYVKPFLNTFNPTVTHTSLRRPPSRMKTQPFFLPMLA
jgi:hypothetical protein